MKAVLGRGLASLLDDSDSSSSTVSVDLIDANPFQPRKVFNEEAIKSLSESIKEKGVIQPILVREKANGRFELIAGERRLRASKMADMAEIPVIVKELSDRDSLELAILENIQREDLNPIDEAQGYVRLMKEFNHTQEDLSRVTGKSRSYIANSIRLLNLPEYSREMLVSGKISVGHAKLALSSNDPDSLVRDIVRDNLTVRQAEAVSKDSGKTMVSGHLRTKGGKAAGGSSGAPYNRQAYDEPGYSEPYYMGPSLKDPEMEIIEERISNELGVTAVVNFNGKSGQIIINFDDLLQLDGILKKLVKSDV